MKWEGKAIGGALGAMIGGPVGAGVGAAVGHLLADGENGSLQLKKLHVEHQVFSSSGPGMVLTPVWEARGLAGVDCELRLSVPGCRQKEIVVPEHRRERCEIPPFFFAYALFEGKEKAAVKVEIAAPNLEPIFADFSLELPAGLRRLGSTGEGRMVMALLACARAGGRGLQQEDVRYIRGRCTEAWKLEEEGISWLRSWLKALREVEEDRLSAEKVAERVGLSTELPDQETLLGWLVEGGENHWTSAAARRWVDAFGAALGLEVPWSGAYVAPRSAARAAQILGIPDGSSLEEARVAWRRLVQENHPDRAADPDLATRRTAQINAAWTLLREVAEKSEA